MDTTGEKHPEAQWMFLACRRSHSRMLCYGTEGISREALTLHIVVRIPLAGLAAFRFSFFLIFGRRGAIIWDPTRIIWVGFKRDILVFSASERTSSLEGGVQSGVLLSSLFCCHKPQPCIEASYHRPAASRWNLMFYQPMQESRYSFGFGVFIF